MTAWIPAWKWSGLHYLPARDYIVVVKTEIEGGEMNKQGTMQQLTHRYTHTLLPVQTIRVMDP